MGIFNLFSGNTEQKIREDLDGILREYHLLKALAEKQKFPIDHLRSIQSRIETINHHIRSIHNLPQGAAKMQYLKELAEHEKALLNSQKGMARELERIAREAIKTEQRTERIAREIEKAA